MVIINKTIKFTIKTNKMKKEEKDLIHIKVSQLIFGVSVMYFLFSNI